jgi:hypothetical protein
MRKKEIKNKLSALENGLHRLQQQFVCSQVGHSFEFIRFCNPFGGFGAFECSRCHLVIERPLTDREDKAASILLGRSGKE